MTQDDQDRPDLSEYMTWEELKGLPQHIARRIELWEGRVVWLQTPTPEHQHFSTEFRNALLRRARQETSRHPDVCWRATSETDLFLTRSHKNDFVAPDFMVYRCLSDDVHCVHVDDAFLVGEVRSPSNTESDVRAKKLRYAAGGIPMYWEVELTNSLRDIKRVTASALLRYTQDVFPGIAPLQAAHYVEIADWTPADHPDGIEIGVPFPIHIPWAELAF